ncbi:LPS biosynthesis protein [Burkholderia singularis]|uniref:LPS-assembly protein LptD n=1 Tax=Burkholderia singularis TaxID=1503053 RepID=A0A124P8C6_9BURK|nr:LPS-assembly protein LptD [Burkholderia singularis]KVE24934.1 LPS biosynthesis protein [Burkholderia singularis]
MPPKSKFPLVPACDAAPRKKRLAVALLAVPGLVPVVSQAQLSGAAAEPQPLGSPWDLRLAPQLTEHSQNEHGKPAAFVLADHASGTADQDLAAKGSAEIRKGNAVVKADAIHYDEDTDLADAYGAVTVANGGATFKGPEAHLKVEANQGYMTTPKYHFAATGGSGSAERVQLLDSERSVFTNGTYTGCQCATNPAWYIKGSEFDFDTGADEGVAKNGVLFFQGVPLFGSPWLTFPLSGNRRSGFLPPTFSPYSSTNGFEFSLPYYFNIAPNRDLTLTPRIISKRGVFTQATFRYLSTNYAGTLTGEFLPDDRVANRNRYALYWQHQQNFGHGFGGYINYNKVSDNTYPGDFGSTNQFLSGVQTVYQQEAGLTYNNGPWSVLGRYQHWQTLAPSIAPYGREPQLNVKYTKYNVGGFDFGAEADYSRFRITTSDMPEGDRVMFNPYISYGLYGPGYFVVPKAQLHIASYDLTTTTGGVPGQPKRFTYSIPTFSLDAGLVFDRSVRLFGQDYIQTLEPRLYYVYTPYRNQQDAPLFDTAVSDFGLAEIFTPNTFVGNDRIADANRLTAALTTRFINAKTGDERARFVIAQQYYFTDQRVTLGSTPATAGQPRHSDLILGASVKLGAGFASETAFQYNADNGQLVKSSVGFGFSPGERHVINVGYRYTRQNPTLSLEPINQFLVAAQWPLTRRLYAVGRFNYDLASSRVVDGLVGFQYDADCWAVGVGIQRYANGVNTSNQQTSATRVLAQLVLKGLTSVDNGLIAAFKTGVQGYTPLPSAPPPLSRFSNYD